MVIIIGSNKGGAGKTTTAIATGLAKKDKEVCIIDADNQKSISRWASDREESEKENLVNITCLQKTGNIDKTIKDLKSGMAQKPPILVYTCVRNPTHYWHH